MDLLALQGINSPVTNIVGQGISTKSNAISEGNEDLFGSLLNSALDNINETSAYSEVSKNEKVKLALGETTNSHDLTIASSKASTALTYTIAVRDKFMEAYKEIMNMQI